MEFDVLAILPALEGEDLEASADQLFDAFVRTHDETGPVGSVDFARGTFDVAFTVEAPDAFDAIDRAKIVFREAAGAAELQVRRLDAFHVDAAAPQREAVPA
jgi:uncharacterized protein with GYD domain